MAAATSRYTFRRFAVDEFGIRDDDDTEPITSVTTTVSEAFLKGFTLAGIWVHDSTIFEGTAEVLDAKGEEVDEEILLAMWAQHEEWPVDLDEDDEWLKNYAGPDDRETKNPEFAAVFRRKMREACEKKAPALGYSVFFNDPNSRGCYGHYHTTNIESIFGLRWGIQFFERQDLYTRCFIAHNGKILDDPVAFLDRISASENPDSLQIKPATDKSEKKE